MAFVHRGNLLCYSNSNYHSLTFQFGNLSFQYLSLLSAIVTPHGVVVVSTCTVAPPARARLTPAAAAG